MTFRVALPIWVLSKMALPLYNYKNEEIRNLYIWSRHQESDTITSVCITVLTQRGCLCLTLQHPRKTQGFTQLLKKHWKRAKSITVAYKSWFCKAHAGKTNTSPAFLFMVFAQEGVKQMWTTQLYFILDISRWAYDTNFYFNSVSSLDTDHINFSSSKNFCCYYCFPTLVFSLTH